MSGQAGSRGYLVQTLVALLDSLNGGDWITLTIEPDNEAQKVDLAWQFPASTRVVQVKSSQNTITQVDARRWAAELEQSISADEYELRLIGPISAGVAGMEKSGRVRIPIPLPLNPSAFIEQAAHRLDHYLQQSGHDPLPPRTRELFAGALTAKLLSDGTVGRPIRREEFDKLLSSWIAEFGAQYREPPFPRVEIPHELPFPPNDFTGRSTELATFESDIVESGCRVAGIRGMPGVGKSIFASKLAQELLQYFPDGQVYLDLGGTSDAPASAETAAARVIRSFKRNFVTPPTPNDCLAQYRTLLHGRRVLILAEDADSSEQIEALTPGQGSLLLFTSRKQFTAPGLVALDLLVMQADEALALALTIVPRAGDRAADLVQLCGYLPLAIRVSSSTLAARRDIEPLEYVRRLVDATNRLELVESSIELSVLLLQVETRNLFLRLAVFPGDFDLPALAAIWEQNEDDASRYVGTLLSHSLVEWDESNRRYRQHDLIRLYARKHISDEDASRASTAFSSYFLKKCREADALYRQGADHVYAGLALFDKERQNLDAGFFFAAMNAALSDEAAKVCNDYVVGSVYCRELRQSPAERLLWLENAARAAHRLGDFPSLVMHTGNTGRVLRQLGKFEQSLACSENILTLAREKQHPEDEARAQLQIGMVFGDLQRYSDSAERMEIALQIARKIGDVPLEMNALNNLGALYLRLGQYEKARDYFEPALAVLEAGTDPYTLAQVLTNCGQVLMHSSEPNTGVEMLEAACGLFNDLGETSHQQNALLALGEAYVNVGRESDASEAFEDCLSAARHVENYRVEAQVLGAMGEFALAKGNLEEAECRFDEAMEAAKAHGDNASESFVLQHFADLALARDNRADAIKFLEQRVSLATVAGDRHSEAVVSWNLGILLARDGFVERAIKIMQRSVDYLAEVRHPRTKFYADRLQELCKQTSS